MLELTLFEFTENQPYTVAFLLIGLGLERRAPLRRALGM